MKNVSRSLSSLALAGALGCVGVLAASPANSQTILPVPGPVPVFGDSNGTFHSSNGMHGTYTERVVIDIFGTVGTVEPLQRTSEDTIVYKSAAGLTRTVRITTINNSDGTESIAVNDLDFGATVPSTEMITYPLPTIRQTMAGTGIFTSADGTTGTLTAIRTETSIATGPGVITPGLLVQAGLAVVTSVDLTSSTGVLTRQLRTAENTSRGTIDKVASVDAAGTLKVPTITRVRTLGF